MEYRKLLGTELLVSRLCYGTWNFADEATWGKKFKTQDAINAINTALEVRTPLLLYLLRGCCYRSSCSCSPSPSPFSHLLPSSSSSSSSSSSLLLFFSFPFPFPFPLPFPSPSPSLSPSHNLPFFFFFFFLLPFLSLFPPSPPRVRNQLLRLCRSVRKRKSREVVGKGAVGKKRKGGVGK
jgi:hypothetical protein